MCTDVPGTSSSCSTAGATRLTIQVSPPVRTTASASGPWGTIRSTVPGIWLRAERPPIGWRASRMSSARISTKSPRARKTVEERDDQLGTVVELEVGRSVLWRVVHDPRGEDVADALPGD